MLFFKDTLWLIRQHWPNTTIDSKWGVEFQVNCNDQETFLGVFFSLNLIN